MSRPIKFRSWDKNIKEWITEDNMPILSDGSNKYLEFGDCEEIKFMQYTGLKDKNGVEIYEGDIWYDDQDNHIGEVSFDKATFVCVSIKDGFESEREEKFIKVDEVKALGERIVFGNLEVIGNIYENPELLEQS